MPSLMNGNPDPVQHTKPARMKQPNPSVQAELTWNAELHRRQAAHVINVWQRLQAWPRATPVTLRYGPDRKATGTIADLNADLVQLQLAASWTRWIPLLQVEAIDGQLLPTSSRLERPQTAGVAVLELASARHGS